MEVVKDMEGRIDKLTEEMPLVSVIIPIYNVEEYLEQCINSVVNQTYQNLDIILVDDGSPDHSPEICDAWAVKDSRIQVIHKRNGGLSDARNAGLRCVQGRYIAFVDSDDWIAVHMIENMVHAMLNHKADMVICQFMKVYPNGEKEKPFPRGDGKEEILNQRQLLELLAEDRKVTHHVWRKLYKAEYVPKDIFPIGRNYEDTCVMPDLAMPCKKVVYISDAYYFYRVNENGIVNTQKLKNLLDRYYSIELFYKKTRPVLKECAEDFRAYKKMELWYECFKGSSTDRKNIKKLQKKIRNELKDFSYNSTTNYKRRVGFFIMKRLPFLAKITYCIWRKFKSIFLKRMISRG